MLLELGKAASFALCILSLYSLLISVFFEPNTSWQQRLATGLARLAVAACVSLASGLIFSIPARTNPDAGLPLWKTLPVKVFFWAAFTLAVLFVLTWYLRCGGPVTLGLKQDCF